MLTNNPFFQFGLINFYPNKSIAINAHITFMWYVYWFSYCYIIIEMYNQCKIISKQDFYSCENLFNFIYPSFNISYFRFILVSYIHYVFHVRMLASYSQWTRNKASYRTREKTCERRGWSINYAFIFLARLSDRSLSIA